MLIGIDGNEANIKNRVGVNKYAYEIIKGIYQLLPQNKDLIVHVYLKDKPLPDMPDETYQFKYKILEGGKVWILTKLTPHLLFTENKPDVFFSPSHYAPPVTTMPVICSIMDLGYLKFSEQFKKYDFWQLKYWTAWSINRSKYVLTISNATKEDIVRQYPSSSNKIVVTYPGVDEKLLAKKTIGEITKVKHRYSIVGNYILYLGTLKPSKNIEGLLKAFSMVISKHKNIQLVIGGKKGWLYDSIFKVVKELKLEDSVIFTDFVDEKDKATLIKGAEIFVLPSFWEGFGLDILTSFALHVPVVSANVGSIPEVAGDAAILVDPHDTGDIAKGILKVLDSSKKDLEQLTKKAYNRLKLFSWEKAAKLTLETLRKAINAK